MIDLADATQYVDRIDELRLPCHIRSEDMRNLANSPQAPVVTWPLAAIIRYQDDVFNSWDEEWPSLRVSCIDWREQIDAGLCGGIAAVNADAHRWPGFATEYLTACSTFSHWPGFEPEHRDWAQRAANQHMELEDQLGYWDLWTSRARWYCEHS